MAIVAPELVTKILDEVSRDVILPRFRALGAQDIREKNPGDLVTIADTEAERELARCLVELLPGSRVVGEEGVSADPALLTLLAESAPVWVIDPIDGTGNFVKGKSEFAIIVALVQNQTTLQGWIHDPLLFRTSFAVKGSGAWCDGRRVRISNDRSVPLIGATAWRDRPTLEKAGLALRQLGSAAHEYLALLDGSLDFTCYRRLHPWDHAAGVLIYGEAGGIAACLDGSAYRPIPQDGSLLMAPDAPSWRSLADLLSPAG